MYRKKDAEDLDGESFIKILEYMNANYQKLLPIACKENIFSFFLSLLYSVFQTMTIPNSCHF